MDLSNKCVFCDATQDLNTAMSVTMDSISYDVSICEEHEDDASPKAIKELLSKKLSAIELLRQQAAELGFKLIDQSQPAPAPQPRPAPVRAPQEVLTELSAAAQAQPKMRPLVTPGISEKAGIVEDDHQNESYDLEAFGNPAIQVTEQQTHTDMAGNEMVLPRKMKGGDGETSVRIVDTGGDRMLQHRTELMKQEIGSAKSKPADGYNITDCSFCAGSGENKITKQECPRCSGTGLRL